MARLFSVNAKLHLQPHDQAFAATYLGQAHIAGTGPEGTTCRQCRWWHKWSKPDENGERQPVSPGHFSMRHPEQPGGVKPAACNKPMLNKERLRVPHDAHSCRFFIDNPDAPPARKGDQ